MKNEIREEEKPLPYVVKRVTPGNLQKVNLNGFLLSNKITVKKICAKRAFNLTKWYDVVPEEIIINGRDKLKIETTMRVVSQVIRKKQTIDMSYRHFTIPKKTGGERPIDEPNVQLKKVQKTLKECCIDALMPMSHTAAFAYVKERNTKLCRMKHQANKSNWFLHLDLHHFFNSLNHEWVMRQIRTVYPYSEMSDEQFEDFKDAMTLCWLNDGLPQGTVISPALSNLCMIPFDYELNRRLSRDGFVYTRYADDLEISHVKWFKPQAIIRIIEEVIAMLNAPFTINREKTHYGSRAGNNWGLGLMLNQDNQITVGHEKKRKLKAELHHLLCAWRNMKSMEPNQEKMDLANRLHQDALKTQGRIAYLRFVEPGYGAYLQTHLEEKIGVTLKEIVSF